MDIFSLVNDIFWFCASLSLSVPLLLLLCSTLCRTDIFVFLLSTRAGGLGINLTAADTVSHRAKKHSTACVSLSVTQSKKEYVVLDKQCFNVTIEYDCAFM